MFEALILSSILFAAEETPMQPGACTTVDQMKTKALPADSSDRQAGVVHAALLYFGDSFAGVVYATRGGTVWYQGSGKFNQPISNAAHDRAMTLLGISPNSASGTFVVAPKPSFAGALAPDVKLKGCF